jgi:hypothetical protein
MFPAPLASQQVERAHRAVCFARGLHDLAAAHEGLAGLVLGVGLEGATLSGVISASGE